MTEQKEFPFFVNGQYWKTVSVGESIIRQGHMEYAVMTELRCAVMSDEMPAAMAKMKYVRFQLVECGEQKYNMVARWHQGFWLVDDDIYIEDGNIYMKEKVGV
jgi:hypothetical protein